MKHTTTCPRCGRAMKRFRHKRNYFVYQCVRFGHCGTRMTVNLDGTIRSHASGKRVRQLRVAVHNLLDKKFINKCNQYEWLQKNTTTGHVGTLTRIELCQTKKKLKLT